MASAKNPRKRNATPAQIRRTAKNRIRAIQRQLNECEAALAVIIKKHGSEQDYRKKLVARMDGCKDPILKRQLFNKSNRNVTAHIERLKHLIVVRKDKMTPQSTKTTIKRGK